MELATAEFKGRAERVVGIVLLRRLVGEWLAGHGKVKRMGWVGAEADAERGKTVRIPWSEGAILGKNKYFQFSLLSRMSFQKFSQQNSDPRPSWENSRKGWGSK